MVTSTPDQRQWHMAALRLELRYALLKCSRRHPAARAIHRILAQLRAV